MYEYIELRLKDFNLSTDNYYENSLQEGDVVYSYFKSDKDSFEILNDWDEGENNDPFWDKEKDEHCIYVFLKQVVKELDEYILDL